MNQELQTSSCSNVLQKTYGKLGLILPFLVSDSSLIHTLDVKRSMHAMIGILYITLILVVALCSVRHTRADDDDSTNKNLRRTGVLVVHQPAQYFSEDEKFWLKHFHDMLSTPSPTIAPVPRPPTQPTPPVPSPTPPVPTPTTTLPPSNGQTPTTPPPVITPTTLPPVITRPPSDVVCNGITQLERAQQLTDIAVGASGRIEPGSPQDIALEWLIQTDPFFVCPDNPKALQRYILAVFYYSTEGDDWEECSAPEDPNDANSIDEANDNCSITTTPIAGGQLNPAFLPTTEGTLAWLTPVYECEWAGITCRVDTTCVDRIEFEDNGVGGTLPFEVRDLPDLRFLILERGFTEGTIPTEFAQIEDLLFLDLDFNELTGTIPEEIYTLTDLFQLDLNDNFLTGTLSPSVGNLSNLVFLQVSGNELEGPIPNELGQLTALLTGSFEMNDLTGSIPQQLCDSLLQKPAYILITDCSPEGPGRPPKVECTCCTDCFPEG